MKNLAKQAGFTFLELMAFLAISSIFTLAAITATKRLYSSYYSSQTKSSAETLLEATQDFFEINCQSGLKPQPTIATLVSNSLLLKTSLADTKTAGTLTPSIVWGTSTTATRIVVTGKIATGVNAASYLKSLGADRVSGQNIIWDRPAGIISRNYGQEILQNLKLYGVNSCR